MRTPCAGRRGNRIAAFANLAGRATAKHAQVSKVNGGGLQKCARMTIKMAGVRNNYPLLLSGANESPVFCFAP